MMKTRLKRVLLIAGRLAILPACLNLPLVDWAFGQSPGDAASSVSHQGGMVFPDRSTTGVLPGSQLQSQTGKQFDVPHTIISDVDIEGMAAIVAPGVTLRNCRIRATGWAALIVKADNVAVENCDIDGQSTKGIRGISISGNNIVIRHNNIRRSEDGIYLANASNVTIEQNYVHDLQSAWDGPHFDGIATDGGVSNIAIVGNTIENPHPQTSAVMISNYFGPVAGVRIAHNRLVGGGYTIYADAQFTGGPISNISITDNRLGRGVHGFIATNANTPEWMRNVDDRSGSIAPR